MKKIISLAALVFIAGTIHGAAAPGPSFEGALPTLPPNQEIVIQEITLAPGQVGRPHSEPEARHRKVKTAPGTAIARAATAASGFRQTSCIRLATEIPVHRPMPSQAVGTWM